MQSTGVPDPLTTRIVHEPAKCELMMAMRSRLGCWQVAVMDG